MDNQNRRADDKRAPGQLQWGESIGAALAGAGFTATIAAAPVLVPDIVMHGLRITKDGITYNGQEVKDAGIVHAALMDVLNGKPLPPATPASADNPSQDEILSLHRQLAGEKLRANQGWARAEAKSKECIELRERMAADNPSTAGAADPVVMDCIKAAAAGYGERGYDGETMYCIDCQTSQADGDAHTDDCLVTCARAYLAAPVAQSTAGAAISAAHRAVIEEAAQVLESAAAHNRSKGRTVLERIQQDRADRLRTVLAAPAAQAPTPAQSQWQPIETAPQDKMLLLAAEFDHPGDWRIKVGGHWDGRWNVFGATWEPTRWMPLPAVLEQSALRTASKEGGAA